MANKKTLAKLEQGDVTRSVAYGCAAVLDRGLEEQLGTGSEEADGLGGAGRLVVGAARRLQAYKHELEAAREALARIEDELRRWRRRREPARQELYDRAKQLRDFCRGVFDGDEGDLFLGLHGILPREPKALHAATGSLVRRLADDGWPMPDVALAGFDLDRERAAESLIEAHGELGHALAAIQQGEIQEAMARAAKKRAANVYNEFLGKSSRFLVAALELAGLDDLAAILRPRGRGGRPPKSRQLAAGALPAAGKALPAADKALPAGTLQDREAADRGEAEATVHRLETSDPASTADDSPS